MNAPAQSRMTGAYVRPTNNGDHHVVCDIHGVLSWHIRSYRFALLVASRHVCDGERRAVISACECTYECTCDDSYSAFDKADENYEWDRDSYIADELNR